MRRLALTPSLRLQDLPPRAARFCLDVERFCRRELALDLTGKSVLVAVSGGVDSLALLLALYCLAPRLGCTLIVAHLDHGVRPESAQEGAQVAVTACRLGLLCVSGLIDAAALAKKGGMGLEEAARTARLDFLEKVRQERGCHWTALGHQLNDLAEDSLMRLMRGAGWPGLAGMEACDPDRNLLRPLLFMSRIAVDAFAAVFDVTPAEDATNQDIAYLRNRVRKTLLPLIMAENPAFLDTIIQRWRLARRDAAYFASVLPESKDMPDQSFLLSQDYLASLPEALRLRLYKRTLDRLGRGQALANSLFALDMAWQEKSEGKRHLFPGGKSALVRKEGIRFFPWQTTGLADITPLRSMIRVRAHSFLETSSQNMSGAAMNILIFGPNGSGKGTQGALIKGKFSLAHIESGAIFREHIGGGTELGKKAKVYIARGDLVPDEITIPMVLETLCAKGAAGWLLDGFPRNMAQAQKLWEAMLHAGMRLDYTVEILLPREVAKNRIMGRRLCVVDNNHPNNIYIDAIKPRDGKCRVCCGELTARVDDQDEVAINKRHDIYYNTEEGTLAATYFFKDLAGQGKTRYIELDGEGDIASVKEALLKKLGC